MLVNATTLDTVRIEVLGEARAVRMTGYQWVDVLDNVRIFKHEVENVLHQLDELAEVWGDEGKFRRCRDRLRKALEDNTTYRQGEV